jgi:hypothetical protein
MDVIFFNYGISFGDGFGKDFLERIEVITAGKKARHEFLWLRDTFLGLRV